MRLQLLVSTAAVLLSLRAADCKKVKVKVTYPHHEIHKHHVTKIPDLKIETVPVEKEIKVLVPYKVPYEVKVPYIVHQKVHTHVEHKPPKKHHHSHHHHEFHSSGSSIPVTEHLFEDGSKYYLQSNGFAASDIQPMFISHHPVEYPHSSSLSPHSSSSSTSFYDESGQIPQYARIGKVLRADLNDFTSTLHTSAFSPDTHIGFGSQEGVKPAVEQHDDDEDEFDEQQQEKEYEEVGPVLFRQEKRKTKKVPASSSSFGRQKQAENPTTTTTTTTTTPKPPPKKRHHHQYHRELRPSYKERSYSEHPVNVGLPYKLRSTFVRADEYDDDEE